MYSSSKRKGSEGALAAGYEAGTSDKARAGESKFNQSEAVTRCRGIKESKLRGQYALAKLMDEEATVHNFNLEETRYQTRTQLFEIKMLEQRQEAESKDAVTGLSRKTQFTKLVDKLSALKLELRAQEEWADIERAFKMSVRHKRAAFQVQLARLEKRQQAERNELVAAQTRLAQTATRIRSIEVANMKDQKEAQRLRRQHAQMDQQNRMKQQKESQFLREIQLCKSRQLAQLTELEITNSEELQDLLQSQKMEEFKLREEQKILEADMNYDLNSKVADIRARYVVVRQQMYRVQLARAQKRQAQALEKIQRMNAKAREKAMLIDNPLMLQDNQESADYDFSEATSMSSSMTQSMASGGAFSVASDQNAETSGYSDETSLNVNELGDNEQEFDNQDLAQRNKAENARAAALSAEDKEIQAYLVPAQDRIQSIVNHHRHMMKELKSQQKVAFSMKTRDHKRKISELLKEHMEEMEALKNEQAQIMDEFLNAQVNTEEISATTTTTDTNQGLMIQLLPDHIRTDVIVGASPKPLGFEAISVACSEVCQFRAISSEIGPENTFKWIEMMESAIDRVLKSHVHVFKVKFDNAVCILASGLSKENSSGKAHLVQTTLSLLECIESIHDAFNELIIPGVDSTTKMSVKFGITTGPVVGALIGTSYKLMGNTMVAVKALCASSEPGCIQASETCRSAIGAELVLEDDEYYFEERGVVAIEGVGNITSFWVSHQL